MILSTRYETEWGPHSLGQSVEWKRVGPFSPPQRLGITGPHSLGQSVEWKLEDNQYRMIPYFKPGPTRWGNQLNGNFNNLELIRYSNTELRAPLAGAIS